MLPSCVLCPVSAVTAPHLSALLFAFSLSLSSLASVPCIRFQSLDTHYQYQYVITV